MAEEQHGDERSRSYLYVFIALAIFTALEVGVSYLDDLPQALQVGALVVIAVAKVALVVLWFMHLRYDRRVFAVPFVLGLVLAVPLVLYIAITLDEEGEAVGSREPEATDTVSVPQPAGPDAADGTNGENGENGEPDGDAADAANTLEVTQSDSDLDLSANWVRAGEVQFHIANESAEDRQLSVIRPGSSLRWMLPWQGATAWTAENRPFEIVQSAVEVPADETVEVTVTMDSGRYVLMSGLPLHTIGNDYAVVQVRGETTAAQEEPGEETALSGEQLVSERCVGCHELDRVTSADKSAEEWAETVDQMIGYGAQLNEQERQAVIDYLAETH